MGILDKDNITKEKIAKLAAILGDSLRSYNADTDTILRLKADITSLEYDLSSTNVI